MKFRVTGLVLAGLASASLMLNAFASTYDVGDVELPPVVAEEAVETEEPQSPIYLNGEEADMLVHQVHNYVCYVTVESFVAAVDSEAMVEEENGVVTVTASTVTEVVDVEGDGIVSAPYVVNEANVVEETLTLSAWYGAFCAVANGRYLYVADSVILVEGKVALPIRVLAKIYNMTVAYDGETQTIQVNHQEGASAYLTDAEQYYDSDTLYWLSHIIHAESGNQSLEGKLAVGNVVMNRVADPKFPDNIYDVLFQRNQFSPAASGSIYREPNAESVVAAKLVLDGAEVLEDALFFNRAGMNTYAARNRDYVTTIGAHSFYA